MATSAKKETVNTAELNVYAKLLAARNEFYEEGAKKTGKNNYAEFKYFELIDIVPIALPIFTKYGLLMVPCFEADKAIARVVNTAKPEEYIDFAIPLVLLSDPGKLRMNDIQGIGAAVTYYRRYLYMVVLDLVEKEEIDNATTPQADATPTTSKKKPATTQERQEIKQSLTNTEGNADKLQIDALKAALRKLKDIDTSKEEFIQEIALKTQGFTDIKKSACEKLIITVNEMIENYNIQEE